MSSGPTNKATSYGRSVEVPSEAAAEQTATQNVADLAAHLAEVKEAAGHFVHVQADLLLAKVRRAAFFAALALAGLVAAVSFLATVVVLLISGIASGVTELVGNRAWLGNSITAAVLFAGAALAIRVKLTRIKTARLRELVERNERRKKRHDARLGRQRAS